MHAPPHPLHASCASPSPHASCASLPMITSRPQAAAGGSFEMPKLFYKEDGRIKAMWEGLKENYKWVLNTSDLENGISNFGAHTSLRVALDRMVKGESPCLLVGV